MSEPAEPTERTCPWCSASASPDATTCPACGAALAQRESIGDLAIPGVTAVDPALHGYDSRPLRLRAASPSQGLAGGMVAAAAIGGPLGLAAIGGIAAVAAVEYGGASLGDGPGPIDAADVGNPSEAARMAVERLDRGEQLPSADRGSDEG